MKRTLLRSVSTFTFLFLLISMMSSVAIAQDGGERGGKGLTEAQKIELAELKESMRNAGATDEEIHDAIQAKLKEWGIEVGDGGGKHGGDDKRGGGFWDKLTDEQAAELKSMIEEMKENGATGEEVIAAIKTKLQEWGIELGDRGGKRDGDRGGEHGDTWWNKLTAEQQSVIKALIASMKENGATSEEIHTAIQAQLAEWGIELKDRDDRRDDRRSRGMWGELTDEQAAELREMMSTMRSEGATADEIRDAVAAKLKEWGIERDGGGGRRR